MNIINSEYAALCESRKEECILFIFFSNRKVNLLGRPADDATNSSKVEAGKWVC